MHFSVRWVATNPNIKAATRIALILREAIQIISLVKVEIKEATKIIVVEIAVVEVASEVE
jgi:hypothetical protein